MKIFFYISLAFSFLTVLPAEENRETAEKLQKHLKELRAVMEELDEAETRKANQIVDYLTPQLEQFEGGSSEGILNWLGQVSGQGNFPPVLLGKVKALEQDLRQIQKAREEERIAELTLFLEKLSKSLQEATQPEHLDRCLVELHQLTGNQSYGSRQTNPELAVLARKVSESRSVISEWQNYLMAEAAGDIKACRRSLENISRSLTQNPILPRSYVLRLLNPQAALQEQPKEPQEDDLAERDQVLISFEEIVQRFSRDGEVEQALQSLRNLPIAQLDDQEVKSFQAGVLIAEELKRLSTKETLGELMKSLKRLDSLQSRRGRSSFWTVRNQVLCLWLNENYKDLGYFADWKKESALQVFEGWMEQAIEERDWKMVVRMFPDFQSLHQNSNDYYLYNRIQDLDAIRGIMRGEEAERNQQWAQAIREYQKSIEKATYSKLVIAPFEALRRLKNAHPEEFALAIEEVQTETRLEMEARVLSLRQQLGAFPDARRSGPIRKEVKEFLQAQVQQEFAKYLNAQHLLKEGSSTNEDKEKGETDFSQGKD